MNKEIFALTGELIAKQFQHVTEIKKAQGPDAEKQAAYKEAAAAILHGLNTAGVVPEQTSEEKTLVVAIIAQLMEAGAFGD